MHWSSEIAKWEYRELQASAMSVDYTGNNVLLAGRRWLAIKQINLEEDAGDIVKKYPRQSKYDAAGAEWCQTYQGQKLCAIAVSFCSILTDVRHMLLYLTSVCSSLKKFPAY